jgi:hypothetical protein
VGLLVEDGAKLALKVRIEPQAADLLLQLEALHPALRVGAAGQRDGGARGGAGWAARGGWVEGGRVGGRSGLGASDEAVEDAAGSVVLGVRATVGVRPVPGVAAARAGGDGRDAVHHEDVGLGALGALQHWKARA